MQNIQLLPEHIIDQIKAGEVIERPSALVKEIIENSIDAGSGHIELHLIDNGLELISIIDNGKGMNAHELPLAFCRHATSKIDRFDDIYKLHSYGFRGEALASIASISKITCETKTTQNSGLIRIEGGQTLIHDIDDTKPQSTGTKLFIKELFYNTPARLKFIQSKTSEKNHLKKIINAFLLTHPEITFHIKWDDGPKEIFKESELVNRIQDVFFRDKTITLKKANQIYDGVNVEIYLSEQSTRGNAHKNHYIFINDRYIHDIQIHKIILNSAKPFWPEGETGHYIAFIKVPTDEIDVNVHPSKTIIKLFRAPKVYSVISGSIKQLLNTNTVKPSIEAPSSSEKQNDLFQNNFTQQKDINYKIADFGQTNTLDDYFQTLHAPHNESIKKHPSQNLNIGRFTIIQKEQKIFLLNKDIFLKNKLLQYLKSPDIVEETAPLLVSRPIKVSKKPSEKTIQFIESIGYEIDMLSQDTLVMRSFPQKIQNFPYISLLEHFIREETEALTKNCIDNLLLTDVSVGTFNNELDSSSFYDLVNEGILKEIKESDLQKLYE